jgi:hypothetical protein
MRLVEYFRRENEAVVESGSARTDERGFFGFSFLPPGFWLARNLGPVEIRQ